jgi:transcriptional regulator with XRE-family HTH domain
VPETLTPIDPDGGPLQRFAYDLRILRDKAPRHGEAATLHPWYGPRPARTWGIDEVVDTTYGRVSRATVYAALSGERMPRVPTLRTVVDAWTAHLPEQQREQEIASWLARREQVLAQLAGSPRRTPVRPKAPVTPAQEELARELRDVAQDGLLGNALEGLRTATGMSRGHLNEILAGRSVPTDKFLEDLFVALRDGWPQIPEEKDKQFTQAQERLYTLAAKARAAKQAAGAKLRAADPKK